MSAKNDIERNIRNIRDEDLIKLSELAFDKGHAGDDFAKGFDYALAYLAGNYDYEEIRDHFGI